jgi:hypothetical protein
MCDYLRKGGFLTQHPPSFLVVFHVAPIEIRAEASEMAAVGRLYLLRLGKSWLLEILNHHLMLAAGK